MSRNAYARLAGITFLSYIALALTSMTLFDEVMAVQGISAKLASVATHATTVRLTAVLDLLTVINALVLAVALYAITRDYDSNLAMLAMCCRVAEAVIGALSPIVTLGLLSLATIAAGPDDAAGASATDALGALLLKVRTLGSTVSATVFAVGSMLFAYLFLRARSIPVSLAWFGLLASVLLVGTLPLQLMGFIKGSVEWFMWMPMLIFEVGLALWLIIKGVKVPATR